MNRALRLVRFGSANTFFRAYFAGNLDVAKGTGPITFTRSSSQYVADNEGLIRKIDSGVPAFSGLRMSNENRLRYTSDLSVPGASSGWYNYSTTTITVGDGYQRATCSTQEGLHQNSIIVPKNTNMVARVKWRVIDAVFNDLQISLTGAEFSSQMSNIPSGMWSTTQAELGKCLSTVNVGMRKISSGAHVFDVAELYVCEKIVTSIYANGDSIGLSSAGVGFSSVSNNYNNLYANKYNLDLLKKAVPGETLSQIRARLVSDISGKTYPIITCNGGTNDIDMGSSDPVAGMIAQIGLIAEASKLSSDNVLLFTIQESPAFTGTKLSWLRDYNAQLKSMFVGDDKVTVVDISVLLDLSDYAVDKVHPLITGHQKIMSAMDEAIILPPGLETYKYIPTMLVPVQEWSISEADGTPIPSKGLTFERGSTNLCICEGRPRADAYGSTLASGTAVKGKTYEIVARISLDWGAVATLVSGTANTVGAKYLITGTLTFTATETGKECIDYVGTKAYHDGTVFQNPITGMTLSGDVAAVLSIVTDQSAIDAAKLGQIVNGGKVYKLDNRLGTVQAIVDVNGDSAIGTLCSASVIARNAVAGATGYPHLKLLGVAGEASFSGTAFTRYTKTGTLIALGRPEIKCNAGGVCFFIVPANEELPFSTSIMPYEGGPASRSAVLASIPVSGNIPSSGRRKFKFSWTPSALVAGFTSYLGYSGTDANNYVAVISDGTSIYIEKKLAGVSGKATRTMTLVKDTQYIIEAYIKSDNTLDIKVDGNAATSNTSTTTAPVFGTNFFIGSNGTTSIMGDIADFMVTN